MTIQIAHHPVFHLGLAFCCAGCAADGPCMCSYDVVDGPAAAVALAVAPARSDRVPGAPRRVAGGRGGVAAPAAASSRPSAVGADEPTLVDVGG